MCLKYNENIKSVIHTFYVLFSLKKEPKKSSLKTFGIWDSTKIMFVQLPKILMRHQKLREGSYNCTVHL
jgi:hypothetical protein